MIDPVRYLEAVGVQKRCSGQQELIFGEICGLLKAREWLWLPLHDQCTFLKDRVGRWSADPDKCSAVYFGTPTIVRGKPLFPETVANPALWTKDCERHVVRGICHEAAKRKFRMIISGLGSGDISVDERLEDMGGGEVVAMKKFDDFTDWVLARPLK